ncbi:hypothetical protein NADFUDRAFT_81143 [Nadsonia fulvescens var. elongata DSM 6958]|uniref:3-methyl-2-oxobutanoate hydroxymethyltransferase n=1 Tax=Nadsonia fulvescens var. elongata DSM 6958 TaxID=857566 RepID=A0A1E3PRL4_9ASCO|nr:hypothetical protein NADFUDRAFT_81143 [Nadsonia fulvescens var. elongata DSM 6958]
MIARVSRYCGELGYAYNNIARRVCTTKTEPIINIGKRLYSAHHAPPTSRSTRPQVTIPELNRLRKNDIPISMITAHDYVSGLMADQAGVDMILVGDSLAMVALGYANTNEIEFDEMIYHAKAVSRGVKSAFIIADLPFGTYEISPEQAVESAIQMIRRGKSQAIKIEGGQELVPTIKKLTSFGIPVMGHIGLTPQRQSSFGGFKVQGKTAKSAESILDDALALQEAGCFAILLEAVPDKVGQIITDVLDVPVIGIGAGPYTSGQVLVQLDMLGGFGTFSPKFLKKYSNYLEDNITAIKRYSEEVKDRSFPAKEHCYSIKAEELDKFKNVVDIKLKAQEL